MGKVKSTKSHDRVIILSCIAGVLISTYALYVELVKEAHPEYKAFCDINEHASCSKVLTSEYAKGFGVIPRDSPFHLPNCVYGLVFYCLVIFLTTFENTLLVRLQFLITLSSALSCFYFGYLLAFVLRDFCLVCVSMYVVNGLTVYFTYRKMNTLSAKNKRE